MNYQNRYSSQRRVSHRRHAFLPLAIGVMVICGCAMLPKHDAAPVLLQPQSSDFVAAAAGQWPAATWWQELHDPQLDQLIALALKDSPDVAVAAARVHQAQSATDSTQASSGASLTANAALSRTRYSENSFYPPPIGGATAWDAEPSLNFSYDFDFWGRNKKALQAALGREDASRAEMSGAAASLSAAVASQYYQWQVLNQRIIVQQQVAQYQQHLVDIELKLVKAGLSSGNALSPLRANAALPQQTLVQLNAQREQGLAALKSLVASGTDFPTLTPHSLPQMSGGIPNHLALDLISRRADVAAARDRVQASLTEVEAARAAFYPDINLSAVLGLSTLQLSKLFQSSSIQAGVTPAIHLPLFDAGRLRAGLNSNRAEVELATAQYNQSVQHAVGEINDAALRVQGAGSEAAPLAAQLDARQHELVNAQKLYKAGLQDGRGQVQAQLLKATLEDQELARRGRALQAHIDLIKALGGGYQAPVVQASSVVPAERNATPSAQH
jgi:NodT family efflux transporter outer membrane factor (OMF) lipoprotein